MLNRVEGLLLEGDVLAVYGDTDDGAEGEATRRPEGLLGTDHAGVGGVDVAEVDALGVCFARLRLLWKGETFL